MYRVHYAVLQRVYILTLRVWPTIGTPECPCSVDPIRGAPPLAPFMLTSFEVLHGHGMFVCSCVYKYKLQRTHITGKQNYSALANQPCFTRRSAVGVILQVSAARAYLPKSTQISMALSRFMSEKSFLDGASAKFALDWDHSFQYPMGLWVALCQSIPTISL